MFFKAEMRIKSNTEEFKSSRRRKEGACNVYGGWGRHTLSYQREESRRRTFRPITHTHHSAQLNNHIK